MNNLTVMSGDCLPTMRKLPDESVHLIVTSPPYWALRDYKIPPSIWGGLADCEHDFSDETVSREMRRGVNLAKSAASTRGGAKKASKIGRQTVTAGFCKKCNAWRGVFGLEPDPELYLEHMTSIMREAKRVLRKDGTLWLNLGDTYVNDTKWGGTSGGKNTATADHQRKRNVVGYNGRGKARNGHEGKHVNSAIPADAPNRSKRKAGDLVGIPWRAALALQADGWYLRRDNIWFKPNPMPESVRGWSWRQHRIKTKAGWDAECLHPEQRLDGHTKRWANVGGAFTEGVAEFVDCPGCSKCEANGGLVLERGNWRCTTSHEYVFQFSKSAHYFCDAEAAREKTTGGAHGRGKGVNPKATGRNSRARRSRSSIFRRLDSLRRDTPPNDSKEKGGEV